ncbi:hypothetical protein [Streptosporangium sp. NPDC051022]|uniref:hypothetical protein n=1 Tax=Streptosporangium sp. NPDC051022 TaxID=3155752 RepID=UPI00342C1235
MSKPSAPVLDRTTSIHNCGCFADAAPMPMGCALCGHAPYAHGCPGRPPDHDYAQPDGALMNARLEARRRYGPRGMPAVPDTRQPLTPAPADDPEPPPAATAVRPARPPLPRRVHRPFPRPGTRFGVRPAAARPVRRDGSRRSAPGVRAHARAPGAAGTAPPTLRPPAPYSAPGVFFLVT